MITVDQVAKNFDALSKALKKFLTFPTEHRKKANTNQVGSLYYVFEDSTGKRVAMGTKSCIDPRADAEFLSAAFLYRDAIRRGVQIQNSDLVGLFRPIVKVPAHWPATKNYGDL